MQAKAKSFKADKSGYGVLGREIKKKRTEADGYFF